MSRSISKHMVCFIVCFVACLAICFACKFVRCTYHVCVYKGFIYWFPIRFNIGPLHRKHVLFRLRTPRRTVGTFQMRQKLAVVVGRWRQHVRRLTDVIMTSAYDDTFHFGTRSSSSQRVRVMVRSIWGIIVFFIRL